MSFVTEKIDFTGVGILKGVSGTFEIGQGTLTCEEWDLTIEPKTMEGTLTVSGTFIGYKIFKVLMEGTLIVAGTLSKTAKKVVAGTLNTAGTLIKKVNMTFTGILNVGGAATKLYRMTIEGTLNVSGSLIKKARKILAGTLIVAGTLSAIKYRLYRITSIAIKAGRGILDNIKARKVM